MAAGQENGKTVDPFEAFRGMRDVYLDAMSKVMINAVNSEEYAQATGALLDSTLKITGPLREALDKAMVKALEQLSLPSRQQVVSLAERFTHVEMRLDDMEAKMDRILEHTAAPRPAPVGNAPKARRGAAAAGDSGQQK